MVCPQCVEDDVGVRVGLDQSESYWPDLVAVFESPLGGRGERGGRGREGGRERRGRGGGGGGGGGGERRYIMRVNAISYELQRG